MNLNQWRDDIHENAKAHGWWDEPRTFGEIIALCHSELSEALEEYRNGHEMKQIYYSCSDNGQQNCAYCANGACYTEGICYLQKPEGVSSELADCIIRIPSLQARREKNIGGNQT